MIKLKIRYYNDQTDIRFPCTEKALQEALAEIDAEQVRPLELYVTEVVFPEELDFLQDRFANLDEVNYLAKRMDSFFGDEEYQFYEAMKLEGFDMCGEAVLLPLPLIALATFRGSSITPAGMWAGWEPRGSITSVRRPALPNPVIWCSSKAPMTRRA